MIGQLGFGQNTIVHFEPNPLNGTTPRPTTYAGQTEIIELSTNGAEYATVGTATFNQNSYSNPVVGQFDIVNTHWWLHEIKIPGTDRLNGMQLCVGDNEEIFVGAMDYQTVTQTLHKYLIKLDPQGNPLWAIDLGPGNIRSMIYDQHDNKVIVHGDQDNRLYLASIDGSNGALEWGFTYSGNPVDAQHIAGQVLLDPADEELVMIGTGVNSNGGRDILAFKIERNSGQVIWDRRYRRSFVNAQESAISACFHPGANGNHSLTLVGRAHNNSVLTLNINPDTNPAVSGIINWQTLHRASGWIFDVQKSAYNPISDRLFVAGGARDGGGYSQGLLMPIDPTNGQGMGTFGTWGTSVAQVAFPNDGNCIFRDIDVHSGLYNGAMRLTGNALMSNNAATGENPALWSVNVNSQGVDQEVLCTQTVPFTTKQFNMFEGDGVTQIDLPIPPFVPVSISPMNGPSVNDCHIIGINRQNLADLPQEAEIIDFNVFPNPASETLTVQLTEVSKDTRVLLRDASGRLVDAPVLRNKQGFILNVRNLSSGMYFLQVNSTDTHYSQKVVID